MWRWLLLLALIVASIYFGIVAAGRWWAAGVSPSPDREEWAFWGNFYFGIAFLCFVGVVILSVRIYQLRKR